MQLPRSAELAHDRGERVAVHGLLDEAPTVARDDPLARSLDTPPRRLEDAQIVVDRPEAVMMAPAPIAPHERSEVSVRRYQEVDDRVRKTLRPRSDVAMQT